MHCRTSALGGHLSYCSKCKHKEQSYNSCLNRHCPKCKGGKVFKWVSDRQKELLDVEYFHLVFTIPSELRGVFYQNKRKCYDLLFKSVSETLNDIGRNNFKVSLGYFGVLHTWNQELNYHPHIHIVLPAVGITEDNQYKNIGSKKFLFPVRVLSKLFQGKLVWYLKDAYRKSELKFFQNIAT